MKMKLGVVVTSVLLTAVCGKTMADNMDFGERVQHQLNQQSNLWFGIKKPLGDSAPATTDTYRSESQTAADQVLLARGLEASYVTRIAGNKTDMMVLWPQANPTHLVTCVEGGREQITADKYNPSVQAIELASGEISTLLRGMDRCDGIRSTAWNTIVVTEETSDGAAYEIIDPLSLSEQVVVDRTTGVIQRADGTPSQEIVKRPALPVMAWEGLTVLDSGVVIAGDELRPGTADADVDGGAIFKFVPAVAYTGDEAINDLSESPLVSGSSYAMQVSCRDSKQQYGQGCEVGNASWIPVNPETARVDADMLGATGYYRPEDLHADPTFSGEGVRFCWTNTGNERAQNFGEVMCGVDAQPLVADLAQRSVVVNRFVEGDSDFNSVDNLAFQPHTGNLYVIEDHKNGDVFACLPDGGDRDIKTDGCIKILSVKDSSAEPTGFFFDATGETAYLSIQHSDDSNMPLYDDYATDDVLKISGFKVK